MCGASPIQLTLLRGILELLSTLSISHSLNPYTQPLHTKLEYPSFLVRYANRTFSDLGSTLWQLFVLNLDHIYIDSEYLGFQIY